MNRLKRPAFQKENQWIILAYREGKYLEVLIDEQSKYLDKYFWSVDNRGYAKARVGKVYKYMHRLIMGEPPILQVDHINGTRIDNRSVNLRLATNQQNQVNRHVVLAKSGFKGVYQVGQKWVAHTKYNGKGLNLGRYNTPEEASEVYRTKMIELHGEFAL